MPQTNVEERMAKVEGILEQMAERLNHIETGQISLREGQEGLRKEFIQGQEALRKDFAGQLSEIRSQIQTNFRWMVGITITMWVTIILSIGRLFATIVSK